jgi:hypothetical protein
MLFKRFKNKYNPVNIKLVHAFNSDSIKTKVNGKGAKPQKEAVKVSLNFANLKGKA